MRVTEYECLAAATDDARCKTAIAAAIDQGLVQRLPDQCLRLTAAGWKLAKHIDYLQTNLAVGIVMIMAGLRSD